MANDIDWINYARYLDRVNPLVALYYRLNGDARVYARSLRRAEAIACLEYLQREPDVERAWIDGGGSIERG
jgi:hypothetical protein